MTGRLVVVVDWQERLVPAMPEALRERHLRTAETFVGLASALEVPVWRTEQYPAGLGPTVTPLAGTDTFAKTTFSLLGAPGLVERLDALAPEEIVLLGMETHICVALSAVELASRGHRVTVLADAVLSRRRLDWEVGLRHVERHGVGVRTMEMVAFGWLGQAGGPVFKELSRRIR